MRNPPGILNGEAVRMDDTVNIQMSGIDHSLADVSKRECFALSSNRQREIFQKAKENEDILGLVILSTCNRTEIYLSLKDGTDLDPFKLFLEDIEDGQYRRLSGKQAFLHLGSLSCGAQSRIFGEEQILTQVKSAIAFSRENAASDNLLEVFFRSAIAAAKKVRTQVRFQQSGKSAAEAARRILDNRDIGKKILVIGNGEVGRQTARELLSSGYKVSMTRRQYRHSPVSIPKGAEIVDYDRRYEVMCGFDAVISATASPHFTVSKDQLLKCSKIPSLFIDLALPRDIEPQVGEIEGISLLDIDEVADSTERFAQREKLLSEIEPFLQQGYEEFMKWKQAANCPFPPAVKTHFPLFINSVGKKALVVGGGKIAARRVNSLAQFSFEIQVVAPEIRQEILSLEEEGRLSCEKRVFHDSDLEGVFMVLAATDDREVNHRISLLASHRGIYASIADKREECSFYFPAIAMGDEVTAGLCGDGVAHRAASQAAKKVRQVLE